MTRAGRWPRTAASPSCCWFRSWCRYSLSLRSAARLPALKWTGNDEPAPFPWGWAHGGVVTWNTMTCKLVWLVWAAPAVLWAADAETNAWDVLNRGLADGNPLKRAQAITALGAIGALPQVLDLAEAALLDKDPTVRQTAAAVLGEMRARSSAPRLRKSLEDESPEVSFTAAKALWEMGDQSGREIFWEVLAGERKTSEGAIKGGVRDARNKLHNPRGLAV